MKAAWEKSFDVPVDDGRLDREIAKAANAIERDQFTLTLTGRELWLVRWCLSYYSLTSPGLSGASDLLLKVREAYGTALHEQVQKARLNSNVD